MHLCLNKHIRGSKITHKTTKIKNETANTIDYCQNNATNITLIFNCTNILP